MIHATMHAHAHAACGPISVAGVSMDTFLVEEIAAERGARGPNVPAQCTESLTHNDTRLGGRSPPCPNAANTPKMERHQMEGTMHDEYIGVVSIHSLRGVAILGDRVPADRPPSPPAIATQSDKRFSV